MESHVKGDIILDLFKGSPKKKIHNVIIYSYEN